MKVHLFHQQAEVMKIDVLALEKGRGKRQIKLNRQHRSIF